MSIKSVLGCLAYYLVLPTVFSSTEGNIPLCPPKTVPEYEYPYVVYGYSPARCYVASRQGPCSEGSVLFAKPKSHFGVCSCECFLGDGIVFDDTSIGQYRYCINKRLGGVYVYDKKRCSCYRLGSQGPCPPGQILDKDIYEENPKCVKEDSSTSPTTEIEEDKCPPGTIYSTLLNDCTDMSFTGLPPSSPTTTSGTTTTRPNQGRCPPGTIYSTLLNICTDMNFRGTVMPAMMGGMGGGSSGTNSSTSVTRKCPPGTIYSTLLNICTDMNFHGLSSSTSNPTTTDRPLEGTCPPGTIYSTLLNICTDMWFTGLPPSGSTGVTGKPGRCPPGTIYSTLLNICTDMNFKGLSQNSGSSSATSISHSGKCPKGTIYSTLLNRCVTTRFHGLPSNTL